MTGASQMPPEVCLSGKMEVLDRMLVKLLAAGHKVSVALRLIAELSSSDKQKRLPDKHLCNSTAAKSLIALQQKQQAPNMQVSKLASAYSKSSVVQTF